MTLPTMLTSVCLAAHAVGTETRCTTDKVGAAAARAAMLAVAAALAAAGAQAATLTQTTAFDYEPNTGRRVKQIVEPDESRLCLVEVISYDACGNRRTQTRRNCRRSRELSRLGPAL
jgi:hypothetical protein